MGVETTDRAPSRDPLGEQRCPASRLPVEQRPHWRDIELSGGYRVSFAVIGGKVLHTRPVGNAGATGMPRLFEKRRGVLEETGLWDRSYCEIKDYSGISLRHPRMGRVQFSDLLSAEYERGKMRGYWGYGGPRVFRWIMSAAKVLSPHPDGPAFFVPDYATAVSEALQTLERPLPGTTEPPPRRFRKPDWNVAVGGYRLQVEVWDDHILFAKPEGRLSRTAAAHLFDLMERVISDGDVFLEGDYSQLSDLTGLKRLDWNALRYVQQRYNRMHDRFQLRGVVVFGSNRPFQPVARLARTVLPFPYKVTGSLDDGLRAVRSLPRLGPRPGILERLRGQPRYSEKELNSRITELLRYAGTINWHAEGIADPDEDAQDPLASVYALLRVLKLDFDTMLEERDRMQAEMLKASKLSSIGRLTAGMAHELNSPLTAVQGYAEHIHQHSTDPRSADQAGRALKSAHRMRDIIDQLSAYSRTDPENAPVPVDVNQCIKDSLELIDPLLEQHRIIVTQKLAAELPPILTAPAQLQSVLVNLLTNAFDAYGEPGHGGADSNPVTLTTRPQGDWIEILCQDWGAGMSRRAQDRAFDPFFTTKDVGDGTGLGLYVTHRIVTECGGTIQLHSEPGQGTTVHIRIPAQLDTTRTVYDATDPV